MKPSHLRRAGRLLYAVIERYDSGTWERVAAASTGSRGFFTRTLRAEHGDRLRLVDPASAETSPTLVVV